MKITIKNTKSDKESAYKSGANLPNIEGVNWDVVNPGATTGGKPSKTKFNTMNLPMMGTNFQTTIEAGKEKEFDNLTPIQAIFMESASKVINSDGAESKEEDIPVKYEWTLGMITDAHDDPILAILNYEEGQTLEVGDRVNVIVDESLNEFITDSGYELVAISKDVPIVAEKFGSVGDANDCNIPASTPMLFTTVNAIEGDTEEIDICIAIYVDNGEPEVAVLAVQKAGATILIDATEDGDYSCTVSGLDTVNIISTLDTVMFDITPETQQAIESQGLTLNANLLKVPTNPVVADTNIEFYPTQAKADTIPQGTLYYALDSVAVGSSFALNIYTYLPDNELIAGQAVTTL